MIKLIMVKTYATKQTMVNWTWLNWPQLD